MEGIIGLARAVFGREVVAEGVETPCMPNAWWYLAAPGDRVRHCPAHACGCPGSSNGAAGLAMLSPPQARPGGIV